MIKQFYASVCRWLLRFITLQLFLSLVSLPLLVAWGLPLSLLSPFGNSVFNPLLALFLLLSTLLFITELTFIPNLWLCWLLERTTWIFTTTSSCADSSWLIGIRLLPLPLLFILPFIALWIVLTPKLRTLGSRAIFLACTLTTIWAGAYLTDGSYVGSCNYTKNKATIIAYADHTLAVFDCGSLNATFRYRTWWDYTLMPQITKKTGNTAIDYLVCSEPSEGTLEGLALIAQATRIKTVVIATAPQKLSRLCDQLQTLQKDLKRYGTSCTISPKQQNPQLLTHKIGYQISTKQKSHLKDILVTCDKKLLSRSDALDKK